MTDYSDLGFPGKPEDGWPTDPYDEDGDCDFCFNGSWKHHAPWCQWADARDAGEIPGARPDHNGLMVDRLDLPRNDGGDGGG